jgi:hypothetical protein
VGCGGQFPDCSTGGYCRTHAAARRGFDGDGGGIPFALIAEQVTGARNQIQDLGLPIPQGGSPAEALDMIRELTAIGAPMYFISAALLIVIGLARLVRGA